ncbi:MAG TPA: 50S ribosomal protein L3 [Myxococcota bacterium]|nr:50S ribosomal protein L3 [Myxococcota bacterium]
MSIHFLCRKVGMTQLYGEGGECVEVTVLEAAPNRVVQKKTSAREGYDALQLGYGEKRRKVASKAEMGHAAKANVATPRYLRETRVTPQELESYEVGQEIRCDIFKPGQRVDVIGTSKGRGTAGVVKRHHFPSKGEAHGAHENYRHGGSIGPGSFPGHVIKGLRMAGRMGNERVTGLNIEVVRVDAEKGLLFVRGGVPGHPDALLQVRPSVKVRA